MQCGHYAPDTQTTSLGALVRDILTNDYDPGSIVIDTPDGKSPAGFMNKVALMLLSQMFGGDMAQWDVTAMTPALWATVQAKMAATGWRMLVASESAINGLTSWESATFPDHYLWQDQDISAEWPVYHLAPAGIFLAVHPNSEI